MAQYRDEISDLFQYNTDQGGNVLHLAVQFSSLCLIELLPYVTEQINGKDVNGKGFFNQSILMNIFRKE